MARYGKKAAKKVKRAMEERKRGTLRSGRSGKKVTSRKQAIAICLSEARRAGVKVPRKKSKAPSKKKSSAYFGRGSSSASSGSGRPPVCSLISAASARAAFFTSC